MLDATIARAKKEDSNYIAFLKKGVEVQDKLFYDEPPTWQTPVSQILGFALLKQKQYVEAEAAFRTVLITLQRNGRTLFGLMLSLKGQGRYEEAYWIEREMIASLQYATTLLKLSDL